MSRLHRVLEALRDVTHNEPSPRGWRRLVSLCQELQGQEEAQVALEYLRPPLERWPDELRHLTHRDWLHHDEYPPVIWPLVRTLRVRMVLGRELGRLEQWCLRGELRHLSLYTIRSDVEWARWAPAVRQQLQSLELRSNMLRDANLPELFSAPWPALETLDLVGNWLYGEGLDEVLRSTPALKTLNLQGNPLRQPSIAALARAGHPTLEALHLRKTPLTIEALERLSQGSLPSLREVEMDPVQATEAQRALWRRYQRPRGGLVVVDEAPGLAQLVGDLRAGLLSACTHLRLEQLTDPAEQWATLCAARLPALEALEVNLGAFEAPLGVLERAPWVGQLRALGLSGRGLRDEGARRLARMEALRGLEELALTNCELGPSSARALRASPHLRRLRRLGMKGNRLEINGIEELAAWALEGGPEAIQVTFGSLPAGAGAIMARAPALCQPPKGPRRLHALQRWEDPMTLTQMPHNWERLEDLLPLLEARRPPWLVIPGTRLDERVGEALAALRLPRLERVSLVHTRVTPEGLARLLEAPWMQTIAQLWLHQIALTEALAAPLLRWRPQRLKQFSLWVNARSDEPRRLLRGAPWLHGLERLSLPDLTPP